MSDIFEPIFEPIISPLIGSLLVAEAREQASWGRESVPGWRQWLGDPRNESGGGDGGGEGGGEGGEGGSGGEGGAGGGAGAPDIAGLFEAFNGFREDVTSRFDGIEASIPREPDVGNEPAQRAPEPDIFDPRNFSDEDFDDDGYLTREAQARAMNELVDQRIAEARAPELAQQQADRRASEANTLAETYPDLQDPEKFTPVIERAQQFAGYMAKATGNSELAEAWREPKFIEMVYLANAGREAAARETPAGGQQGVTLENGGSAGPGSGGGGSESDVAKRIVGLASKSKFRLGSGSKS